MEKYARWIKVEFMGAARMVVGSCFVVSYKVHGETHTFMVDCGMFQGTIARKHTEYSKNIVPYVGQVEQIFLTHGHNDHCGRIPFLVKMGYRNEIYATKPVTELAPWIWKDSAKIQEHDYRVALKGVGSRREYEEVTEAMAPLYGEEDCNRAAELFVPVERNKMLKINQYLSVRFTNAGHSLGSACIEVFLNNGHEEVCLLFSGDIGDTNPILKRRIPFAYHPDYVFLETTYGGRLHEPFEESVDWLITNIAETLRDGGNVIVPAFAAGRTQEFLYELYKYVYTHDDWRAQIIRKTLIVVDSFLGVSLTKEVYQKNPEEFKAELQRMMKSKDHNPFNFPNLKLVSTKEESMEISARTEPTIIISSAGMCNAGRVQYHLENNLPRKNALVVLIGYQAEGTLGRQLFKGVESVKIHHQVVPVRAKIITVNAFSAHCDQDGLIKWLDNVKSENFVLNLVHGEASQQDVFRMRYLSEHPERTVEIPEFESTYYLSKDGFEKVIAPKKVPKLEKEKEEDKTTHYRRDMTLLERIHDAVSMIEEITDSAAAWRLTLRTNEYIKREIKKMDRKMKKQKEGKCNKARKHNRR